LRVLLILVGVCDLDIGHDIASHDDLLWCLDKKKRPVAQLLKQVVLSHYRSHDR
jgi:hypothetical protein